MSKNPVLYKSLAIGVIVLFLGIGIQPAFAVTPKSSVYDSDCDICPKISNLHFIRLKSIFYRFEMYNNIQYIISKNHPEIIEIYQKLSYKISEYDQEVKTDKQNKNNGRESICNLLWIHIFNLAIKDVFFTNLGDDLLYTNPILGLISYSLAYMYYFRILIIGAFGFIIGCFDYWFQYY